MVRERPGENVSQNVRERVEVSVTYIEDQVNLIRTTLKEIRERVGIPGKEPKLPKKANLPGRRSGLAEMPIALAVTAIDNTNKFLLKQAEITRKWVK